MPENPFLSFTAMTSEGLTIDSDLKLLYNLFVFRDFGALDLLFWDFQLYNSRAATARY